MTILLGGLGYLVAGGPGAKWGLAIGSLLDSSAGANSGQARRDDLKFSGAQYGSPIARGWGKFRTGGAILDVITDSHGNVYVEHQHGGGKKGDTSYTYTATVDVAFARATAFLPDGTFLYRGLRLTRIWANESILIWDSADSTHAVEVTVYPGTYSQSQDPTFVAFKGSGNVPRYSGLIHAAIKDLDLSRFGGVIPNFSAEFESDPVTYGDVIEDMLRMAGLRTDQIDVTAATRAFTGFGWVNRTTVDTVLNEV